MSQRDWWEEAQEYAQDVYGITLDWLGYEDGDEVGEGPSAYVERKAEKYGLTSRVDIAITEDKQFHGTSRVRITTYRPVVERPEREGDEY